MEYTFHIVPIINYHKNCQKPWYTVHRKLRKKYI
jgi:hypothetical protein